jgi:hypothetical protein
MYSVHASPIRLHMTYIGHLCMQFGIIKDIVYYPCAVDAKVDGGPGKVNGSLSTYNRA